MRYSGLEIFVTPDSPKMKLAPGDYVTPAYRAEIDAWLLTFFGPANLLDDGKVTVMGSIGKAWMNPRTYAQLKNQVRAKP